ncbi:hypothetical protein [Nocardioides sp. SYSU DS0651]|uniref:hypothetical protein n=1 Tax=Nocardioides sp. SYSU DS0651 TaxID=3415955 RepID=UPI003F4C46FF
MHWPADLDPADLRQPDRRTCGAATALAARAILEGWRPVDPPSEILAEHRRLTSVGSARGRLQLPWLRALGTPPWALVNLMRSLTGMGIATVSARPRPAIAYLVLREQLSDRPVVVYLGNRWLPRHVVLAVGSTPEGIEVFDPAAGRIVQVDEERWTRHRVGVAGWSHFWFVV